MKATLTFEVTFDLRPATGVNPKNEDFEVVDEYGMRIAYVSDIDDAESAVLGYCDEGLILDGKVTTAVEDDS